MFTWTTSRCTSCSGGTIVSWGASVFTGDGEGNFSAQRQGRYADWMGLTAINPDPMNQHLTGTGFAF